MKWEKAKSGQEMPVVASPKVAVNHFADNPIVVVQTNQE